MPTARCPQCGGQFKAPEGLAGRKTRCPRCKNVFVCDPGPGEGGAKAPAPAPGGRWLPAGVGGLAAGLLLGLCAGVPAGWLLGHRGGGGPVGGAVSPILPAADPGPKDWVDWTEAVRSGDLELKVVGLEVGHPSVVDPNPVAVPVGSPLPASRDARTRDPKLLVRYSLRRLDGQPLRTQFMPRLGCVLTDDTGRAYAEEELPPGYFYREQVDLAVAGKPGPQVQELHVFSSANLPGASYLFVEFKGFGGSPVKFRVPAKTIPR